MTALRIITYVLKAVKVLHWAVSKVMCEILYFSSSDSYIRDTCFIDSQTQRLSSSDSLMQLIFIVNIAHWDWSAYGNPFWFFTCDEIKDLLWILTELCIGITTVFLDNKMRSFLHVIRLNEEELKVKKIFSWVWIFKLFIYWFVCHILFSSVVYNLWMMRVHKKLSLISSRWNNDLLMCPFWNSNRLFSPPWFSKIRKL
jgi:hypothetical protein